MLFPFGNRCGRIVLAAVLMLGVVGCLGAREAREIPPDERFGHRPASGAASDKLTITIAPPDSALEYFTYPAPFDTVVVRPAPFDESLPALGQEVAVELLIKGAFPDACAELDAFSQERAGHLIEARLTMRKPQGSICASVRRPYRFYVMLDGLYEAGNYTLKLNGAAVPFVVRAPLGGRSR